MSENKKIITMRHSYKLVTEDCLFWQNSQRFKENPLDTPLAEIGIKNARLGGLELIKQHKKGLIDLTSTNYIYTSPMTRCCQTAIELIKVIKEKLNHTIKLRIHSDLWEGIDKKTIQFTKNITKRNNKYILINNKKISKEYDSKLMFPYLSKKYKEYIDIKYNHIKLQGIEDIEVSAKRIINRVNKIAESEPNLAIIVAHANLGIFCYDYFLQVKNTENTPNMFYDSYKHTSIIAIYDMFISKSKNRYKLIYGPSNKFRINPIQPESHCLCLYS